MQTVFALHFRNTDGMETECDFSLLFFAITSVLRNKQPLTDSAGSQSNTTRTYKHTLTTHSAFDTRKPSHNKIMQVIVKNSTSCCEPVAFSSDVVLHMHGVGVEFPQHIYLFFKQKEEYTTNIIHRQKCGHV